MVYTIAFSICGIVLYFSGFFDILYLIDFNDPMASIPALREAIYAPSNLIIMFILSFFMEIVNVIQGIIYYSQKEIVECPVLFENENI